MKFNDWVLKLSASAGRNWVWIART